MPEVKRVVKTMYDIFNKQRVTRSAAAMSYYLTISIFPLLIVAYAILNSLNISNENLYKVWEQILPADVLKIILGYLQYVGGAKSTAMLVVGITVTLTSSSSAFGSLISIMADIQGKPRYRGFWATVFSVVISVGLLAVMYVSGLVIVSGEWLLDFLETKFGFEELFEIWQWVRFAILFLLLLVIIYLIYKISAPRETRKVHRMPGALIASVLLVAASVIFSHLIGSAANYPIVYGSLASFIILMFWIYICSIILIMGNVFNFVVYHKNAVVRHFGETP
ncbi:YihY family inner membrane protein [Sporobacter termitidis DSM 10068]|uniref:YihY family inner membrane protein n=1 Tax=Sporobacter termitidis DSM 10068 TaxID=1123282 RepID=A0A1M5WZE1_9FIRM|nr:YihY/virulence factor BrkB family protein [Sporobacter termitidis]SHH92989.1 YihY family inner membrane protein [Sporobacter termitidis DSM 10068]